jgi:putative ABC transport system permease protein
MIKNYIKTAIKVLGRRKFFTFISLFGITLTLVVLMVATAILDNVFEPRPPESRFERALVVEEIMLKGPEATMNTQPGYGFLDRYLRGLPGAENISFFTLSGRVALYQRGQKIESHIRRTDGAYWQILDFTFVEGAPFTEDDNANGRFVAVITTQMRKQLFGNAAAAGRTIDVDGQRFRVVGVVEPVTINRHYGFSEIWAPIRTLKSRAYEKETVGNFQAAVLAKSAADFPKLRAAFQERLDGYVFEDKMFDRIYAGLDTKFEAQARDMFGQDFGEYRTLMLRAILIGAALLFITLPTLNLVSINLSRIMERASEIGVRKAFGASSRSLVGQFVVENIVLTLIGGLAGFLLTIVAIQGLNRLDVIPFATFDLNVRVFAYGLGLAVVFGIFSGVYPAWRMSRMHPVNALRGGAR